MPAPGLTRACASTRRVKGPVMTQRIATALLTVLVLLLGACGSDSDSSAADTAAVQVVAPADGSTLHQAPIDIVVRVGEGLDAAAMRVLLAGVDISHRFGQADADGLRRASIERSLVNLGRNQLLVNIGTQQVPSSFLFSLDAGAAPAAAALPLLVPIRTRVVSGDGSAATDYAITLYTDPSHPDTATTIPAPAMADGSNTGFQVVYLRRSDLVVVSNQSVPNAAPPSGLFIESPLAAALYTVPSECGTAGCIVVVQSLGRIGYTPCFDHGASSQCLDMSSFFQWLGALGRVAYANGTSQQVAYSFIGNTVPGGVTTTQLTAGTYYERLTCSGSNYGGGPVCDALGFPNTSFSAPANATPSQIGAMAGVLVRDNFNNFTYAQNAPPVHFATRTDKQAMVHTVSVDGTDYASSLPAGAPGGLHLVILNRNDLSLVRNLTLPATGNTDAVLALFNTITGYKEYPYLFFVSAFGDTRYAGSGAARATWNQTAKLMSQIGGTQQVFYLLNNPELNPAPQDDYTLVGFYVDPPRVVGVGQEGSVFGAESSSVISRLTERNPLPSEIEGLLKMDRQGYYSPGPTGHNLGLSSRMTAEVLSASLLNPSAWPYPGPDPAKSQAAYQWISQALCCSDIRAAYINVNTEPLLWLSGVRRLSYDPAVVPGSSAADFAAMVAQLELEFQYLALVRVFQRNLGRMYLDQQANVSLLLQQAFDSISANIEQVLSIQARQAAWTSLLKDAFGVLGAGSGLLNLASVVAPETGVPEIAFGIRMALSVGTTLADTVAERTNSPAGTPLRAQEQEQVAAAALAGKAADAYAATLISMGNEFDRIASDWGRLKMLGGPLLAGQIPWDGNAAGILLQAYDRLMRREFTIQLLRATTTVIQYPYISDTHVVPDTTFDNGDKFCPWGSTIRNLPTNPLPVLFYPSGAANNDNTPGGHGSSYPYEFQWSIWALVIARKSDAECPPVDNPPSFVAAQGLFSPLDPGNPQALGVYPLWFFTRQGYTTVVNNSNAPCYDGAC